jgi:hypothetical protein
VLAVGAGDDEVGQLSGNQLHRFIVRRSWEKVAGLVQPANGGGVVTEGKDALLLNVELNIELDFELDFLDLGLDLGLVLKSGELELELGLSFL